MIAFLSIIFLLIPCLVLADNTTLFSIDDRDPRIKYSDGWNFTSAENEHNGTGMLTTIAGSYATFTFTGVRVTVFGTVYPTNEYNQRSQYVLDNEPTDLYYGPPNLTVIRYGVRYFESGNLTNTQHTLIITNLSERYILDFIQVLAPSNATPTDSFSSGSPTASFSSTPSLTTVSNGLDRASVVGIAVACSMGTLILVALGFVCYRWRRNMQRRNKGLHSPETSPHPFNPSLEESRMGLMQDPPQPTTITSKMKQRKQAFPPLSYPEASGSSPPYSTNPPSAPSDAGSSSSEHPLRPVPLERIPEPNRRFGPRTPRTLHRKIHEAFSGNSSRRTRNTTPPESQNRDAPPLPPTPTAIRQSIDGGVRVAVGPPVRVTSSEPPQRSGTIPPPYSHYTS